MQFNVVADASINPRHRRSPIGFYFFLTLLVLLTPLTYGCGDDTPETHPNTTTPADSNSSTRPSTRVLAEDSTNVTVQTPPPDSTAIKDSIAKHRIDSITVATALAKKNDSIKAAEAKGKDEGANGTPASATKGSKGEGCPDVTQELTAQGRTIFTGKGNCSTCHGGEGKGTKLGPDLTDSKWLHITGDYSSIIKIVRSGVDMVVEYPTPMPPMGGGRLNDSEVCAVAAFVWSFRH